MNASRKYPHTALLGEDQFEAIYKRLYQRLSNFSCQFTKDDKLSEDIVHEVFMKLWEHRSEVQLKSVDALLFKMVRNLCLNHIKHLKVVENKNVDIVQTRRWEELYRIDFVRDEPYLLIEKELEERINQTLNALPDKCQEVFILSRVNGLKNKEIAVRLNISLKTVEKHIGRALQSFSNEFPLFASVQIIALILSNLR